MEADQIHTGSVQADDAGTGGVTDVRANADAVQLKGESTSGSNSGGGGAGSAQNTEAAGLRRERWLRRQAGQTLRWAAAGWVTAAAWGTGRSLGRGAAAAVLKGMIDHTKTSF